MRFGSYFALLALLLLVPMWGQVTAQGGQFVDEWEGTIWTPNSPAAAIFTVVSLGAIVVALGVCGFLRYARNDRGKGVLLGCIIPVLLVIAAAYLMLLA